MKQISMKQVTFLIENQKLEGVIFFPKHLKPKNPAILFIHGWTSEKKRSYQYAKGLANLGYISFLFDMRRHGKSEGNINKATAKDFLNDVLAAYDYFVKVENVEKENINVVGNSFGSYLAVLLTTKRNARCLVLRVPADYPNDAFNKPKMQASGSDNPAIFTWRTQVKHSGETFALSAIAEFNGEILIIESEKDDVVPHETIQNYVNAVIDKSKLTHTVMRGAPHSIKEGPFRDKVEKILTDWFKKKL